MNQVENFKAKSLPKILKNLRGFTPQASILGPLAFVFFINDLDEETEISLMNKFADDKKCGNDILADQDVAMLQSCLNNLVTWANTCSKMQSHACWQGQSSSSLQHEGQQSGRN